MRDNEWNSGQCPTLDTVAGVRVEELTEVTGDGRAGTIIGRFGSRLLVRFDGEERDEPFYPECLWILNECEGCGECPCACDWLSEPEPCVWWGGGE